MATTLTRNLRLRVSDELTADARYNLTRIDQLASVFPISSGSSQDIKSSGDISLEPDATSLGGSGNGTVFAPNLSLSSSLVFENSSFTMTLRPAALSSNLTLTLPSNTGSTGQFLATDGTGQLSWSDPPTSNLATLNDTNIVSPTAGQILEYNGSKWVASSIGATNGSGTWTWTPADGTNKTITHNFNSTSIIVYIYDNTANCQVLVETIDYVDNNTILLVSDDTPLNDYTVMLQEVNS